MRKIVRVISALNSKIEYNFSRYIEKLTKESDNSKDKISEYKNKINETKEKISNIEKLLKHLNYAHKKFITHSDSLPEDLKIDIGFPNSSQMEIFFETSDKTFIKFLKKNKIGDKISKEEGGFVSLFK